MPLDEEGKVQFTTTLFALIRENLSIKMRSAEEMDQADMELRETILKVMLLVLAVMVLMMAVVSTVIQVWSFAAREKIDLLVPHTADIGRGRLTVSRDLFCKNVSESEGVYLGG